MKYILFFSSFFLFISLAWQTEITHAGSISCAFGWTQNCTDPAKIEIGCKGSQCSIQGGFTGVTNAVNGTFTKKTISEYVVDVVLYFLGFVTLVAVIYVIYAGFQLMIGGGDEEKVKKARQIITYVIIGIILMWAAYWIIDIIIQAIK